MAVGAASRGVSCVLLSAVAFSVLVLPPGIVLAQESYIDSLSGLLSQASVYLGEAADAIADCNQLSKLDCYSSPEQFATRVDQAREGLEGVLADLTLLVPPGSLASSHELLHEGFTKVIDGLSTYTEGLRQADPIKIGDALELVHAGRVDIETATVQITSSEGSGGLDPILLLGFVGGAAGVSMSVLIGLLVVQARRSRLAQVESDLATCPVCGEVLDGWQTYRSRQIRAWRATHLLSHKTTDGPLNGGDGDQSP